MIYLAQTDTTAGFLSYNKEEINLVKKRQINQECLITCANNAQLQGISRVPKKWANWVRRACKTSFLYPNKQLVRVVKNHPHEAFLREMGPMYSSSANMHKKGFDLKWAKSVATVVVDEDFYESTPSSIYLLGRSRVRVLRKS